MERDVHNKLIRDKIPEIITASGGQCEVRVMEEEEFERELRRKITEEAGELEGTPKEDLVNEMADVLELLKAIAVFYGIDFKQVEQEQVEKKEKRGGFEKRLFLVWSSKPNSSCKPR